MSGNTKNRKESSHSDSKKSNSLCNHTEIKVTEQSIEDIKPAEVLKFFHDRYNHLTGLRSMTARHYLNLIGGVAVIFAAIIKFGDDMQLDEIIVENSTSVALFLIFVALAGFLNILYDAMCRKVASGSCDAISLIIGDIFPVPEQNQVEKQFFIFSYINEELLFASSIIVVDAGIFTIAFSLLFQIEKIPEYLFTVIAFFISLSAILIFRYLTFRLYRISGWALPCSDGRGSNRKSCS